MHTVALRNAFLLAGQRQQHKLLLSQTVSRICIHLIDQNIHLILAIEMENVQELKAPSTNMRLTMSGFFFFFWLKKSSPECTYDCFFSASKHL